MTLTDLAHRAARTALSLCLLLGAADTALSSPPAPAAAPTAPRVAFATSEGAFVVEVYPDKAPKTVANFLRYVSEKHYDGTIFHRVIPGFMAQGGGYDSHYVEKPTHPPVAHEGRVAIAAGLRNAPFMLAMARTGDPQSATAQFFVNLADNDFLDPVIIPPGDPVPVFEYHGQTYRNTPRARLENSADLFGYTVFGKVVSGFDTFDKIRAAPTGAGGPFKTDAPQKLIVILSAKLIK